MKSLNVKTMAEARDLAGRRLAWRELAPGSVLLMVETRPGGVDAKAAPAALRAAGRMRQIIVDGILMEMSEEIILGQIRSGAFVVVYPGTNIPWERGQGRHPTYPPDWIPGA